jgi:hypothetical protein
MLSKCANPECDARFRYLHEGKVFVADWMAGEQVGGSTCWRRTEMFWLCSTCSRKFSLSKKGTAIVPVRREMIADPGMSFLREIRISR